MIGLENMNVCSTFLVKSQKLNERRLMWYGRLLRLADNIPAGTALDEANRTIAKRKAKEK